jgi:hypothetical protein
MREAVFSSAIFSLASLASGVEGVEETLLSVILSQRAVNELNQAPPVLL